MMQSSDSKQCKYVEFVFTTKEEGKGELTKNENPKKFSKAGAAGDLEHCQP
jgi:hypothetical protein